MIVWKLDEVLRVKGIKGRELARRMEIGENYLSRVRHEVPERLSLVLLDGLCRELGCSIADLLEFRPGQTEAVAAPVPAKRPAAGRKAARGRARDLATEPTSIEDPISVEEAVEEWVVLHPEPMMERYATAAHQIEAAPAGENDDASRDDFESIVAAALGAAFEVSDADTSAMSDDLVSIPQTRWSAEPVPEAHMDAPKEEPPIAVIDLVRAEGGTVVRTSALSAKVGRLRQRRPL
jgi:DNA-binding Xre family transcriptional regulator